MGILRERSWKEIQLITDEWGRVYFSYPKTVIDVTVEGQRIPFHHDQERDELVCPEHPNAIIMVEYRLPFIRRRYF